MPWCPKCKSEYEKGVLACVTCKEDLVDDLKDYVTYVTLAKLEPSIVKGLLEYLKYSGIEEYQINEGEEVTEVLVNEKHLRKASKHLNVYIYNLQKETMEQEETYENESTDSQEQSNNSPDVYSNMSKLKETRSSAYTFLGLGIAIVLLNALEMTRLTNVLPGILEGILLMSSFILIGIGVTTLKKIPSLESEVNIISNSLEEMVNWYESKNNLNDFYKNKNIDIAKYDEGALYFVALEIIKAELTEQFKEQEEAFISHAADEIYAKIQ
ncbi:MAG: hypothetical protein CVU84_15690 [Firmicutes bacterium HGW-Firmicutes-1]|jgi:hypothetical protein|nr:MAG: hypothetical protein CVU84_15690 [Firmicutes bacterium HGW-Firmicutes-1]